MPYYLVGWARSLLHGRMCAYEERRPGEGTFGELSRLIMWQWLGW